MSAPHDNHSDSKYPEDKVSHYPKLKKMAKKVGKSFGDTTRHPSGRKWRNDDKGTAFESGPYPKKK